MKFVKFQDINGKDIYVNPEHIRFIEDHGELDGESLTTMNMIGTHVTVQGKANDICARIAKETSFPYTAL